MIKQIFSVPKNTDISKYLLLESADGFVFAERRAMDFFCLVNSSIDTILDIVYLSDEIDFEADFYIPNKQTYFNFLLPKLIENKYTNKIGFFSLNNLGSNFSADCMKFILEKYDLSSLLIDVFCRNNKQINSNECLVPIFLDDEAIGLQVVNFSSIKNHKNDNTWVFIPPDGVFNRFDFSSYRLAKELRARGKKAVLFVVGFGDSEFERGIFDDVLEFSSLSSLIVGLVDFHCEKILYRGWMTAYGFGAFLSKKFQNIVVYIKDYMPSDVKIYELLFGIGQSEFDALFDIFKNAQYVLSQYGEPQADRWAKMADCSKEKFIFLPEIADSDKYLYPKKIYDDIYIVHAGSLPPTSLPQEYFPTKPMFEDIKKITSRQNKIYFACAVAERVYDGLQAESSWMYKDWLYENMANSRFDIIRGKDMEPKAIERFHWGVFELSDYTVSTELIEYVIPSKFAFYLEAGLPILVNSRIRMLADITKKYGIGIVFENEDIRCFEDILDISQLEYDEFVKNILIFRERYGSMISKAVDKLVWQSVAAMDDL